MRKSLFLFTLALSATFAQAQFELPVVGQRFMVAMDAKAREHLRISDEQFGKMKSVLDGVVNDDGNGHVSVQITGGEDMDQLDKDALKPLDEKQRSRLEELWLQRSGLLALTDKATAEKMSVTDDQKAKLAAIVDEHRQKLMDMFMSNDGGAVEIRIDRSKMKDLQKATDAKIAALLTEEQTAKWKNLLGEKFEFDDKDGG